MNTDPIKYRRQTTFRLIIGVLGILFILGGGLIYLIYGAIPAAFGLLCLGSALFPVMAISAILKLFEWIVNRYREE